jgi:CheY-like chemotaxis protein
LKKKKNDILNLIMYVSERKKNVMDTAYLHIAVNPENNAISVGEVEQVLEFRFGQEDGIIYKFDDKNLVIMMTGNENRHSLIHFERITYENFDRDAVQVTTNTLDESGIALLSTLIERITPLEDEISRSALKRMRRIGNCSMVLDDDVMVLKTMENILRGFGGVELMQEPEKCIAQYKEYMPNIVFVDIHLKGARGQDVIRRIRESIDPHIYAVMISSDSMEKTVLDVKESGAKGFIVKPITRDQVYKRLLNAPTFVPKS